jgi:ubiquitin carboxyl-terminal hydrolase 4/11/15
MVPPACAIWATRASCTFFSFTLVFQLIDYDSIHLSLSIFKIRNSTIQCLSNTPLLTNYFLSGLYKDQINRDNPLGWQGKIAEEWGKLLEDMWNGKYRVVAPRELKTAIGEFQPRFSGYQQQDSSELLSFLLDGLHEDLNRVLKKPATQPVEFDGRPLDELAKAAWQTHLMRNQSVIVDTCQGQLMSKLVCPKCARVSITFDPFMFFSVPLPTVKDKVVTITFQSADLSAAPIVYGVSVPKLGIMADVKRSLSSMIGVSTRRMVCVDMHQGRVYRMLAEDFGISEVRHSDDIWIHEVPGLEEQDAKVASQRSVPIVVSGIIAKPNPLYTAGSIFHKEFKYESVGRPSMIMLPQSNNVVSLTNAELHRHIKQCVQHWIAPSDDTESKPYTVVLSDRNGSSCGKCSYMSRCNGCELPDDDEPCDLSLDLALNICWTSADRCIPPVEPTRDSSAPSESKAASSYSFGQSEQRSTCSLADCFRAFSEEETLGENDAWYCNKCKDHVLATKKMDVWRAPDVLIIHLKRFQYTRLWREKLDTLVDFPFEGLDMGPWLGSAENKQDAIYDLYAISNHMGGLGGGHYTAYAKNLHNQQWYDFNDSSVTPVRDIEEMKSSSAYVLFYARRGALTSHL